MRLLCLDFETTGTDVTTDRIVSAFLGLMGDNGAWITGKQWLLNSGVPIPAEATAVHGITNEDMQLSGRTDVGAALLEILGILRQEARNGVPIVIYNAPFDLTLLAHELWRHEGIPLAELTAEIETWAIMDPLVIDKHLDKWRRGTGMRKLVNAAPFYKVPVEDNAHDAAADCLMTGRIALRQIERNGGQLYRNADQAAWKREQSESLQAWFHSAKAKEHQDTSIFINPGWPLQWPEQQGVAA